jgi:hypothetical protein
MLAGTVSLRIEDATMVTTRGATSLDAPSMGYCRRMTINPTTPDPTTPDEPLPGSEPAPDPGPITPSPGRDDPPTIDPDWPPGDDPQGPSDPDPDADPATRGLAHRDEDQAQVDQDMSGKGHGLS